MRPLKACLALVVAAFTLTGCMKLEMDLTIAEEDTVSGSLIFAVERGVLLLSEKPAAQAVDEALTGVGSMPKGSRTEVYEDSKYYGRKVIFDRVPLAEFNRTDGSGPKIVHSGGLYTFTLDGDTSTLDLGSQAHLYRQLLDATEVRISVTFPGKVIERDNLATLEGQTVNWRVKLGSKHQFKAVSEEPAHFPWLLVAGVGTIFGALTLVGMLVFFSRRRRPEEPTVPILTPAIHQYD